MSYPVVTIDPSMKIEELIDPVEGTGYLRKFWVEHPQLGLSLIKLEEDTAPAWSEKVSYEIATRLKLPAASYEFGELVGWSDYPDKTKIVISPNFKRTDTRYVQGAELLFVQTNTDDSYSVAGVLETLTQNEVQLPNGYQAPNGINDGTDLFVGYLLLDSLTANNDRHSGNWEIGLDNRGIKTLAPVYDNGASFATTFGSIVYGNYTVEQYMNTDLSSFGEFQAETFKQAAQVRPQAAKAWLRQLAQIQQQQLEDIFARIREDRITPEQGAFAIELLSYNRSQLLNFRSELDPSLQDLASLYQRYSQNTTTKGLAEAVEIAKNALADGVKPEIVADLLANNNEAYQELLVSSSDRQARKIVVRKAQVELALSREKRSSPQQLLNNDRSKGKSR